MDERTMRQLADTYFAANNGFDADGMMAVLHPGIVFWNIANGRCPLHICFFHCPHRFPPLVSL